VKVGLGVLLLLDAVLIVVTIRSGGSERPEQEAATRSLQIRRNQLHASVARLQAIQTGLADAQAEGNDFYEYRFFNTKAGYSAIVSEFEKIASQTGARKNSVSFKAQPSAEGLSEVEITTVVEGDYGALVGFVNRLERSERFYLIQSLSLSSASGGMIRLTLRIKTYFRGVGST
jgi:Tfp pilus assembly protein PilO